jgi:hypothetical protein
MTPSGIEPATCRFGAYCLNHYATARLQNEDNVGCRIKYVHQMQMNSLGTGKLEAILHISLQNQPFALHNVFGSELINNISIQST